MASSLLAVDSMGNGAVGRTSQRETSAVNQSAAAACKGLRHNLPSANAGFTNVVEGGMANVAELRVPRRRRFQSAGKKRPEERIPLGPSRAMAEAANALR